MISTSKSVPQSLLENHRLLCRAIQFSAVEGLGFNFDPEVIARIFLLAQKKKNISMIVFLNTSLLVCQGVIFFIWSGFEEDRIDGIDLMLACKRLLLMSYTRGCHGNLVTMG